MDVGVCIVSLDYLHFLPVFVLAMLQLKVEMRAPHSVISTVLLLTGQTWL